MRAEHQRLVVLDTNVWISAALSPSGTAAQVVRAVLLYHSAVFSQATFAELETRIWKPKFDRYIGLDERASILHDARSAALWVEIPTHLLSQRWSRDPDDDVFIRTALAANASWLLTGDDDLLMLPAIDGLQVMSPAQALGALGPG